MTTQLVGLNGGDKITPGQVYRATFESTTLDRLTPGQGLFTTYNRITAQTPAIVVSEPPISQDKVAVIDIKAKADSGGLTIAQLVNALDDVSSYTDLVKLEAAARADLGTTTRGKSRETARTTATKEQEAHDPISKITGAIKAAGIIAVVVSVAALAVVGYVLARRAGLLKRGRK